MEEPEMFKERIDLNTIRDIVDKIKNEIRKVIVGQDKMLEELLVGIFAGGHVLVEGVPGVAKTLTVKLIAKAIAVNYSRIQFTPDLMPSDILGTNVYNAGKSGFEFNPGPVFGNFILVDEINRAPAKTQSALFEVMEERQATIDGTTYPMDAPFMVFATQNPVEHEGTYKLPEAQLDRFLLKINVDYPTPEEELAIIDKTLERKNAGEVEMINAVVTKEDILRAREIVKMVHVEKKIRNYMVSITGKTRNNADLYLGASPRATVQLLMASRALAITRGRDFVIPDDVREVAPGVLRHRIILSPEKEMEGTTTDDIIRQILQNIEVPR